MALFSRQELQTLTQYPSTDQASSCVSIYISTHEAGAEIQQDPIRLKNQLSEAEKQLAQVGMDNGEIQAILKPAADLIEDQSFWQHQKSGLALFLAPDWFQYYTVPLDLETTTSVGKRFYIKPLLTLVTNDNLFYILAASQNQVMLYQATRTQVHSVNLGDTPESLEVALRYDDPSESLQGHGTGSGGNQKVFHGQGGGKDSENTDILRFFHLVSDGVEKVLGGQTAPLVFLGVDFLFPIYKQANKYPHLMDEAIAFQPDQLSAEEIRDRALTVVKPYFDQSRQTENEQYGSLQNQDQATSDVAQIISAAYNGQIDTLFIDRDRQVWGEFDASRREAIYHEQKTAQSEDLLELAITQALATDAKVYAVEAKQMPVDAAAAAATLRYPVMMKAEAVSV